MTFFRTPMSLDRTPMPFDRTPMSLGRTPMPFDRTPTPFDRTPMPFDRNFVSGYAREFKPRFHVHVATHDLLLHDVQTLFWF